MGRSPPSRFYVPWSFVMSWLFILVGFALLVGGGDALVRGASGLAVQARVSPTVVGLTIVAAGTSMPELVVSLQSALQGASGIALGNVVGSNIFNIGAIVGLAALVRPLSVAPSTLRRDWVIMMVAAVSVPLLIADASVSRVDGGLLVLGLLAFIAASVCSARKSAPAAVDVQESLADASFGRTGVTATGLNVLAVIVGGFLLAGGSSLLVEGAVQVARGLGVTDTLIGLTIVAAGTSAPELMTSLVASYRGRDDIAIANVIGSNIFNVFGILGPTALVLPLDVPAVIVARDMWWMLALSLLMLPMMATGHRVSRAEGALLTFVFLAYMASVIVAA